MTTSTTSDAERRRFHAELLRIELQQRYRFGWWRHAYFDRFGCSPPREWESDQPASFVSPATYQWIRQRTVEFARSRQSRKHRRVSRETRKV